VPLDLNEVIYNTATMLRRLIDEDVALELRPGPDLGLVRADRGQIEQVILNLVVNAGDAMPSGGSVKVVTRNVSREGIGREDQGEESAGPWVAVEVSDTGVGMSPEVKDRVFEPFFTTKEVGHGTGLGLATVFGIVAQSGGDITVESEIDEGTTFTVYLPCVEQDQEARDSETDVPGGDEVVLVVEDEAEVRRMTCNMLRGLGYDVLAASDGKSAIKMIEKTGNAVDLVLSDVVMPRMGGPECAEHLRSLRPELPIVYMSGHAERSLLRHGAFDIDTKLIQKPFTLKELSTTVRKALDERNLSPRDG
jgi:CheY-like chemotaxis protein